MTREEAIEVMKEKLPWLSEDTKRLVMTLVPELAKSEDEEIREWLIAELKDDYFTDYTPEESKAKAEKAIAWLEKQKESVPIPDKFSGLKSLMLQYLQSAANRKDDSEIESDTDLWGRKILDYVWKHSDEQKPIEPECPQFVFDDILALECAMGIVYRKGDEQELYEALRSLHSRLSDVIDIQNGLSGVI